MTDERTGDALWTALDSLPPGSGVIFRHYGLDQMTRMALFRRLAALAQRRRLVLVQGGAVIDPRFPTHGRRHGALTAPVHSRREAMAAIRAGARLLFASPVHATRSHPGAAALGPVRLGLLIRGLPVPVVALGGMDERRWRALRPLNIHGWAGIDAWTRQKRMAVPT